MSFTEAAARKIALALGCETPVILAIAEVESGGRHDLPDGRPQILFEAQWFSKLTGHRYDDQYPGISSPTWNRDLYKGGTAEYGRLEAAIVLDRNAALQSASWGLFQIMGFNYKACGFPTVEAFVDFIKGPDDADMEAFINFVRANPKILAAMHEKDWRAFALNYNGTGAVDAYSAKISDAYKRFLGHPDREEVGPPLPVADPTQVVKSPIKSTTIITTGAASIGGASIIAENVQPTINAVNTTIDTVKQAKTTWAGVKDTFDIFQNGNVLTFAIMVAVVGVLIYVGLRYWRKTRNGEAVST